jgi:hypothetical protein
MKLKLVLLLILAVSAAVQAQQPKSRKNSGDQPGSVTNEDRGRAYIITGDTEMIPTLGNLHSVLEPQQSSVFLGKSWESASLRSREQELGNLLAHITDQAQLSSLDERGVKNFFAATAQMEKTIDDGGDGVISDLEMQRMLSGMIADSSVPRPNGKTIYVIYLGPEIRSTLGEMVGGKHYLAYRNFFNVSGNRIQYVVLPFEQDQNAAYQIALRAFLAAALNGN